MEKPLYLWTDKEISDLIKDINPLGSSTATGAASAWFSQRVFEDERRKAKKEGMYDKAIADGLISKSQVNKMIKSLPY